jgi:hypothetical protein
LVSKGRISSLCILGEQSVGGVFYSSTAHTKVTFELIGMVKFKLLKDLLCFYVLCRYVSHYL